MKTFTVTVLILVFAVAANAQTLNVAETSGKGKVGVLFPPTNSLLKISPPPTIRLSTVYTALQTVWTCMAE